MKLREIRETKRNKRNNSTSNLQGFFRGLSTVPKQAPNSQPGVSFHEFTIANH